jgi:hypothetical protein
MISVFSENGKSDSLEKFLRPFFTELQELELIGLTVNGIHFDLEVTAFICDAPARSFIKCIKAHNVRKGCKR